MNLGIRYFWKRRFSIYNSIIGLGGDAYVFIYNILNYIIKKLSNKEICLRCSGDDVIVVVDCFFLVLMIICFVVNE